MKKPLLEMLDSLTDTARQFFARRARPAPAPTWYRIIGVGPTLDENPQWEVSFFLTGSPKNSQAICPLSHRRLDELLSRHFGTDAPKSTLEDRNHYAIAMPTRAAARQLARELVYVFEKAGILPMADDTRRFRPKKPEHSATG